MGSNSRYDRDRPAGDREAAESRALHLVAELVEGYPGITSQAVAGQVSAVLDAVAIELGNDRSVPVDVRRAVRGLADAGSSSRAVPADRGHPPLEWEFLNSQV